MSRLCPHFCVVVLAVLAAGVSALPSGAATSGTVVGATIPSAIQLSDQCGAREAHSFGNVLPGSPARTDTGANVCRFSFTSSNASSMLRLYQADTNLQAMVALPSAWTTISGSATPNYRNVDGFGTALIYATTDTSATGYYEWSVDGGATWLSDNNGGGTFNDVSVPSATVAWRVGSDGGQRSNNANANPGPPTWSPVSRNIVGPATEWTSLDDISAVDYSTAWGINGATAYRTTNPGAAEPWESSGTGCSNSGDIEALSATVAFAAGSGRVCRTINGTSWTNSTLGLGGANIHTVEISPETSTTVWAGGSDGVLFRSTDNGINWAPITFPISVSVSRIHAFDDDQVYVATDDGLIFHTANAGGAWTRIRVPTTSDLRNTHVASASVLLVGTSGSGVWRSANGGADWTRPLGNESDQLIDVDATDDDVIIAARGNGLVRVSTDGGGVWNDRPTGLAPDNIRGVAVVDNNSFVAVGDRGSVAVTDDAGLTWSTRSSGTAEDLWDVDVQPNGTTIAVGANGTILRSADRGWNWSVRSAAGNHLRQVAIRSGGLAVAVGLDGVIRRSVDDGVTWTTPASGTTENIMSVGIASPTVVYAAGSGALFKSVDAGATWTSTALSSASFEHVAVVDEDTVYVSKSYAGGWTPWVTRSTDGGVTWTTPFSNHNPSVRSVRAIDGGRILFAGWNDWIRVSTPGATIPDYAAGGWGAGTSMFGGCLQDVTGASVGAWAEDNGGATPNSCQSLDTDPWNPVTIAPVKIAQLAGPGTGTVDLVWGFRPAANLVSGMYSAGIVVEAMAPNV